jgi:hypothetical protein
VQAAMDHCRAGDVQMAFMGGVERAAEQSDPDAVAMPKTRDQGRLGGLCQARTWPVPRMM